MKGKIVVVPFPFTDLSLFKRRPALVLHETKYDIVVAYISSAIPSTISSEDVLVPQSRSSFALTGLLSDSVIMLDKLATIEKALIICIFGGKRPYSILQLSIHAVRRAPSTAGMLVRSIW